MNKRDRQAALQRLAGKPHAPRAAIPTGDAATRAWTMENLLQSPRLIGMATADAKFANNASAATAITDLNRAVRAIRHSGDDDAA